jgi:antitoxin PrlF
METTLTSKGQITIPKHIREALSLQPGSKLTFDVNVAGELVLRPGTQPPNPFEAALGTAEIKWEGTTDQYMAFLRGED